MNRLFILLSLLLILSLVLAILVISQQYNVRLSANVPRTYTVPKWQCNTTCECVTPDFVTIGYARSHVTICSRTLPSYSDDTKNSSDAYDYTKTDDCANDCQRAFPDRAAVMGEPIADWNDCQKIGICPRLIPNNTTPPPRPPDDNFWERIKRRP
ncbi:MAG: hypothetical protein UW94_C0012G0039 [Parcubacteria group bacterium GW2011_GWA2_45_14]|nr:MAG: hypothetical protein UW94_C0012G0039 [Parcubacteria group bacterium GW2011_GWA2_45_14]